MVLQAKKEMEPTNLVPASPSQGYFAFGQLQTIQYKQWQYKRVLNMFRLYTEPNYKMITPENLQHNYLLKK